MLSFSFKAVFTNLHPICSKILMEKTEVEKFWITLHFEFLQKIFDDSNSLDESILYCNLLLNQNYFLK